VRRISMQSARIARTAVWQVIKRIRRTIIPINRRIAITERATKICHSTNLALIDLTAASPSENARSHQDEATASFTLSPTDETDVLERFASIACLRARMHPQDIPLPLSSDDLTILDGILGSFHQPLRTFNSRVRSDVPLCITVYNIMPSF
jgi:hypothetical protein